LLGGYLGSAMANGFLHHAPPGDAVIASGWIKVVLFIVIAPVLGMFLSAALMKMTIQLEKSARFAPGDKFYRHMQLLSSACLSLMHGSNDAQKTAGILTGALVSGGALAGFDIPYWVLAVSYGTMGLGTLFGGWLIVRTMGQRLTRLDPQAGVCAESAAALSILAATLLDLPVSTTHVTTGAILGTGVVRDPGKVRWTIGRRIAWGWILTIPAAALMGGCAMMLAMGPNG